MEQFSIKSAAFSHLEIKDAIYTKIQKSKAVITSVMFATEFIHNDMKLDNNAIYHASWVVDDYLEELDLLFRRLEKNTQ